LHKHNQSDVLNFLGAPIGDGDEPLPSPRGREGLDNPHDDQTVVGFFNHIREPVLNMLILEPGGARSLRVNDRSKLVEGQINLEKGVEVCSDLVAVGDVR